MYYLHILIIVIFIIIGVENDFSALKVDHNKFESENPSLHNSLSSNKSAPIM